MLWKCFCLLPELNNNYIQNIKSEIWILFNIKMNRAKDHLHSAASFPLYVICILFLMVITCNEVEGHGVLTTYLVAIVQK